MQILSHSSASTMGKSPTTIWWRRRKIKLISHMVEKKSWGREKRMDGGEEKRRKGEKNGRDYKIQWPAL